MVSDLAAEAAAFLTPAFYTRAEVLDRRCPVPAAPGIYGWWFSRLPAAVDSRDCQRFEAYTLLYTGISPRKPPLNGRRPSAQTLRSRLKTHYAGNAEGSTLRKTLGCLLGRDLGIELRRVGSGKRMTFLDGEGRLSEWMASHSRVNWLVRPNPWELEDYVIACFDLPLNLDGNARNSFHAALSEARAAAVARARALPIAPNPGIGGRWHPEPLPCH